MFCPSGTHLKFPDYQQAAREFISGPGFQLAKLERKAIEVLFTRHVALDAIVHSVGTVNELKH